MAGIPLRSYIREIEKHIENGRNDEAIADCRHILEAYPKYVDAYRLLGKAFLENKRYSDAADILQRVLSSIPEDFVAHVGMSIIREDEGNLDEAIWHMERAFEIQPANSAIQDELRRLYGRRDGVEPPKIRLTRGALARMYYKGGLYQQAIAETRTALAENPNRLDLQVLLTEVYAKTGQRAEAVDIANTILKNIPYCLSANQIMSSSLLGTERNQDAQVFLQRVTALDPYAAFIGPNNPNAASVPDQMITLEKLEWKPEQMMDKTEEQPAWAASLGVELGDLSPGKEEPLPEWLADISTDKSKEKTAEGFRPSVPAFSLDSLGEIPAPGQPGIRSAPANAEISEEDVSGLSESITWDGNIDELMMEDANLGVSEEGDKTTLETEESELVAADIPDWLRAMAPIPESAESTEKEETGLSWLDEISKSVEAETTADRSESVEELAFTQPSDEFTAQPIPSDETIESGSGDDLSKWQPVGEEEVSEAELREIPTSQPLDELPEWLSESEVKEIEIPAERIEIIESKQELPDWLLESETVSEEILPTEQEAVTVSDTSLETEESPESQPLEELPSWLMAKELTADSLSLDETLSEKPAEEIPDWLKEIGVASTADIPEWLLEEKPQFTDVPVSDTQPTQIAPEQVAAPSQAIIEEETSPGVEIEAAVSEAPSEIERIEEVVTPIQESGVPEAETQPVSSLTEDEAAFAWLEGLAAKQGAEEALLLKPEERLETPPEWVQRSIEEEAHARAEGIPSAEEVEKAVIFTEGAAQVVEEIEPEETPIEIIETTPSIPTPMEELPVLTEEKLPKPEIPSPIEPVEITEAVPELIVEPEIVEVFVEQLEPVSPIEEELVEEIEGEEAPIPLQKLDLNLISMAELEKLPGVGFITAQRIIDFRETYGSFQTLDDLNQVPNLDPGTLEEIRDYLYIETLEKAPAPTYEESISIAQEGTTTVEMEEAQISLSQGNLEQALETYSRLIQTGQDLPQVIQDLEVISNRYPREIQVWRFLGDAYLRSDKIQSALDAYVEAERLLR